MSKQLKEEILRLLENIQRLGMPSTVLDGPKKNQGGLMVRMYLTQEEYSKKTK